MTTARVSKVRAALVLTFLGTTAHAEPNLPSTEAFMNTLGTCAAGMNLRISANITGSVKSFFEGARTEGVAALENAPDFLVLFPDAERIVAYRLYLDCVTRIIGIPRDRINAPKSETCVGVAAECRSDGTRSGPSASRSCQRYVDCDPSNPWAYLALAGALFSIGQISASEMQYQKALSVGQESNNWTTVAAGYNGLARVSAWQQNPQGFERAEQFAKTAIEFDTKADYAHGLGNDYRMLGAIYMGRKDFNDALVAFRRSASFFERSGSKYGLGTVEGYIGSTLVQQGDVPGGCEHLRRARAIFVEAAYPKAIEATDKNLAFYRC